MDSAQVRRHGLAASRREENGFEEMVRGFVDNVRVLVRVAQPGGG